MTGGLDDALQQIIQLCKTQNVPYVFALGRRAMGRAVSKLVPVSIIGIFDYSGAEARLVKRCSIWNVRIRVALCDYKDNNAIVVLSKIYRAYLILLCDNHHNMRVIVS